MEAVRGPRRYLPNPTWTSRAKMHAVQEPRHLALQRRSLRVGPEIRHIRSCGQECYSALEIADAFADALGAVEAIAVPRAK